MVNLTPREYIKEVNERWEHNKVNRDSLIEEIQRSDMISSEQRNTIIKNIMENFSKNETEEKTSEIYLVACKKIAEDDKKYHDLEISKKKLEELKQQRQKYLEEIGKTKVEGEDVTTLDLQLEWLKGMKSKLKKIEEDILSLEQNIANKEKELEKIENNSGKRDNQNLEKKEENTQESTKVSKESKKMVRKEPENMQELVEDIDKILQEKDKTRQKVFDLLEMGVGIDSELKDKIKGVITESFESVKKRESKSLSYQAGKYLKEKIESTQKQIEDMPEGEEKEILKNKINRLEYAYLTGRKKILLQDLKISKLFKIFRKRWEKKINLDEENKKKIIQAVNEIKPILYEEDGNIVVEFILSGKRYKVMDINSKKHSDKAYHVSQEYNWRTINEVKLRGMNGDDTRQRKNRKLAEYVEEKEIEGYKIPTIEFQMKLINKLGEKAGLSDMRDKIAMRMYLTGNYGNYRLTMGDDRSSNSQGNSRSVLDCCDDSRGFFYRIAYDRSASLCLIAC